MSLPLTIITLLCQALSFASALPQPRTLDEQNLRLTKRVSAQAGYPQGLTCDLSNISPTGLWQNATFSDMDSSNKKREILNSEPYLEPRTATTDPCNIQGVVEVSNVKYLLGQTTYTKVLPVGGEYELGYGFSREVAEVSVLYESGDFADNDDDGQEDIHVHRFKQNPGTSGTLGFTIKTATAVWFEVDFGNPPNPGTDVQLALYKVGS